MITSEAVAHPLGWKRSRPERGSSPWWREASEGAMRDALVGEFDQGIAHSSAKVTAAGRARHAGLADRARQ